MRKTANIRETSGGTVTVGLPGVVYFVRSGDSIKIGAATNFKQRFSALQTSSEKILDVLAVIPGLNEYEIHQRFAHLRSRGEWFSAAKDLLQFIEFAKLTYGEVPFVRPAKPKPERRTKRQRDLATMMAAYENAPPYLKETVGFTLRRNFENLCQRTGG